MVNSAAHNDGHPIDFPPTRIKAIQAIQDDPLIDAELNPHDGIGTPMGHGHHYSHGYHHGGEGHAYGGNTTRLKRSIQLEGVVRNKML